MRQRWHLWRRKYDLFIGKRQFAAIDGGFLAWEFELKDAVGNTLALIDRCVYRPHKTSLGLYWWLVAWVGYQGEKVFFRLPS